MSRLMKNILMIILIFIMSGCVYLTMNNLKNSSDIVTNNNEMKAPPDDNFNKTDSSNVDNDMNNKENSQQSNPPEIPNNMVEKSIGIKYYVLFGFEAVVLSILIIYLILSKFNSKTFKEVFINTDKSIIFILLTCLISVALVYSFIVISKNYFISDNKGPNMNNQSNNITYKSKNEVNEELSISDKEYTSSGEDESALLITSSSTFDNISVNKTGDSESSDNTSFYGINSGILVKDGAIVNIDNSTIETNANGSNGVFSYGGNKNDGTTINISNTKITTKKDNSGGIMTTGGGNINASNLIINTSGTSSAAIRSDRGGGNVKVSKGTYTTNGKGSPAIYSTANISVDNATLVSNKSEGIVIEGANSVSLDSCTLTDNNTTLNGQSTTYKNIFLYQSMSGDASVGNAEFTSKNSIITTNKGDSFYVTNTTATINLENNKIVNNDTTGNFLRIKSDSWGSSGSNGGDVTLNLTSQNVEGNIVVDSLSTLIVNMSSSNYEGIINGENSAKNIKLITKSSSKIKLLGDSYVTSFEGNTSDIDFNGYKLYVNGKSIM